MKSRLDTYRVKFEEELKKYLEHETALKDGVSPGSMHSLFDPVKYIMSNGGKRIRPMLLMLSCEAFGGNTDDATDAAIAIEILHNFTLVHDDIMDNASTRRGRDTIHKKWDVNTAILVGDELIGLSYRSLLKCKTTRITEVIKTFTDGVIEVCEGQALDKEFEQGSDVTINDYFVMIRKKTAELLKTSASIGAIIGGAGEEDISSIKSYAENIGLAFQIQDDLLDVIGNESKFGKKIGGDILERKKTYLYLKAIDVLKEKKREEFRDLFSSEEEAGTRINKIIKIYSDNCIVESAKKEISNFTDKANKAIKLIGNTENRNIFSEFSSMLLNRKY
ncbi:MAG TPA: polyprenyl synthetase family protein [Ignavibacteria bacterium]|nr:polyprenyl synthetase family protein [Ignavibacteria bacterium]